jgi:DNA-binding CsgD family transcriptional regulator
MTEGHRESGTFRRTEDELHLLLVGGERSSWRDLVSNAPPRVRFEYRRTTREALVELGDGRAHSVLFRWQAGPAALIHEDFCRSARSISNELVLIAVLAGSATEARVDAFEAGADDCIGYDTDLREVLARVQTIARRLRKAPHPQSVEQRATALASTFGLSARERETLLKLALGMHSKQIGDAIGCEYSTVRTHLRRICKKLRCSGTREAIVRFFAYGLPHHTDTEAVALVPKRATRHLLARETK